MWLGSLPFTQRLRNTTKQKRKVSFCSKTRFCNVFIIKIRSEYYVLYNLASVYSSGFTNRMLCNVYIDCYSHWHSKTFVYCACYALVMLKLCSCYMAYLAWQLSEIILILGETSRCSNFNYKFVIHNWQFLK